MILTNAEAIARNAHYGQERKNGEPFTTHLESVVSQLSGDEAAQTVAWLHDIIEDTEYTSERLIQEGIPKSLVDDVNILTKQRELTYSQYLEKIKKSHLATKVKKADIIANLSDNPSNKQILKLAKALVQLCT